MVSPNEKSPKPPPYVSSKTLRNFLTALKQDGIPGRLDSSVMRNLSGATQSQLRTALRYLNLTDEDDRPQPRLVDLVHAPNEDQRKELMNNMLVNTYGSLFPLKDGIIDLSQETPMSFSSKFRNAGLSGDTVRKAEALFISLASDAGIPLPKRLTSGRTSGDRERKPTRTGKPSTQKAPNSSTAQAQPEQQNQVTTNGKPSPQLDWAQTMLQRMIEKFPDFQPDWDEAARNNWFEQFRAITEMLKDYQSPKEAYNDDEDAD